MATPTRTPTATPSGNKAIKTVFLIVMENHNWSSIRGSSSAPYINTTLLPMASHAEQYYNPPGLHPSLGNYLWLESGQCFTYCGTDNDPSPFPNGLSGPALHSQLSAAGISWRGYFEGMTNGTCPMAKVGSYTVHHNPFVYYNDVTSNPQCPNLKSYADLSSDLANNRVARYNLIVPDKCDDMHDSCAPYNDSIRQGDVWLQTTVPAILNSPAYKNGGVLFITWDEGRGSSSDGPIGMIVLSPHAKGGGYANALPYTHSSTLRTLEEIFGVSPYLGDAANATDLRDLFRTFP
jgi:phospholipase C